MPEEKQRSLRVFLSYASQDRPAVRDLYQRLKAEGWIDPWLDEENLTLGQHWTSVIEDALDAADVVIIFLSRNSVQKEGFIQRELNYAWEISLEKPRNVIFLIPFRLDDCEVPRYLRSRQWGDYFGEKKEGTYQTLLRSLRARHQQKLRLEAEERARTEELARKQAEETARLEEEKKKQAAAEKAAREKTERKAIEKAEREKAEREAAEKIAHKKAEKEASKKITREKEEREAAEKLTQEKTAREKAERDAAKKKEKQGTVEDKDTQNPEQVKTRVSAFSPIFGIGIVGVVGFVAVIGIVIFIFIIALSSLNSNKTSSPLIPTQTGISQPQVPTQTVSPSAKVTKTSGPLPTEIADEFGVEMIIIPAGEFTMGSDAVAEDEKPPHQVYLDDFYMDKYEVTNAFYKACVETGKCSEPRDTGHYTDSKYANHPVVYVDWSQAKNYCEWRGAQLPTEAQWEKAARGTDERTYPWGEGIDSNLANYNSNVGDTTKVGNYKSGKSPYGIYDMAGNVWEWVADWYSESYYQNSPFENPLGPDSGQHRVLRGGSWNSLENLLRASFRGGSDPTNGDNTYGFRCVRSP